jgi:TRAP-type C4-dicarboxylate transport system substrate-binding protein
MKKSLALILATALMVTLFAGCGTSKTASEPAASAPAATTETPAATTETPAASTEWDFSKDKQFDLTFSFYLPEGNSAYDWLVPLCDGIKEKTDGTVTVTIYPGGTLAKGDETADAIKNGVADMGLWPTAYALGTFPLSYMLEYPGIHYASAKAATYAFTEWIATLNPAEAQGYKLLFSYCSGPGIYLSASKAIRTVDDFNGLQIRTNSTNAPRSRPTAAPGHPRRRRSV